MAFDVCIAILYARNPNRNKGMLYTPEMFHPPKIPQWQWNGNGMGFQRVPVENPLNADVAPVVDPFFQPLLAVVVDATASLICLIYG